MSNKYSDASSDGGLVPRHQHEQEHKSKNKKAATKQPEKVDKVVADRLNNYAQTLDEPITHVVDYGELTNNTPRTDKNA